MPLPNPEQSPPLESMERPPESVEVDIESGEAVVETRSESELNQELKQTLKQIEGQVQDTTKQTRQERSNSFDHLREKIRPGQSAENLNQEIAAAEQQDETELQQAEEAWQEEASVIIDDPEVLQAMELLKYDNDEASAEAESVDVDLSELEMDDGIDAKILLEELAKTERFSQAEEINPAELDMEMQELGLSENSDIDAEINSAEQRLAELNPPAVEPRDNALANITRKLTQEREALTASTGITERVGDSTYQGSTSQSEIARLATEDSENYIKQLEQQQKERLTERLDEIDPEMSAQQDELSKITARKALGVGWEKDLGFDNPLEVTKREAELKRSIKELEQERADLANLSKELESGNEDAKLVELRNELAEKESDSAAIADYLNTPLMERSQDSLPQHLREIVASEGEIGLKKQQQELSAETEALRGQIDQRSEELQQSETAKQKEIDDLADRIGRLNEFKNQSALRAELDNHLAEQIVERSAEVPGPSPEVNDQETAAAKAAIEKAVTSSKSGGGASASGRSSSNYSSGSYVTTRQGDGSYKTTKEQKGAWNDAKKIAKDLGGVVKDFFGAFKI